MRVVNVLDIFPEGESNPLYEGQRNRVPDSLLDCRLCEIRTAIRFDKADDEDFKMLSFSVAV